MRLCSNSPAAGIRIGERKDIVGAPDCIILRFRIRQIWIVQGSGTDVVPLEGVVGPHSHGSRIHKRLRAIGAEEGFFLLHGAHPITWLKVDLFAKRHLIPKWLEGHCSIEYKYTRSRAVYR